MVSASLLMAMPFMPDAYSAAMTEPALVPATRSTGTLRASSALITPICAKPRAAPPPSASPIRTGACRWVSVLGGGVLVVVVDVALPPVAVVHAVTTDDSAASENARRESERRDDDGFKLNSGRALLL